MYTHAPVELCKKKGAKKIIVAVPVAGRQAIQKFSQMADEVIVLESPVNFYAVAQVYENWHDVSDEEVLNFFKRVSSQDYKVFISTLSKLVI